MNPFQAHHASTVFVNRNRINIKKNPLELIRIRMDFIESYVNPREQKIEDCSKDRKKQYEFRLEAIGCLSTVVRTL